MPYENRRQRRKTRAIQERLSALRRMMPSSLRGLLLSTAIESVVLGVSKGISCPCCGKFCKEFKQPLNAEMARFLIEVVKHYRKHPTWVDIRKLRINGKPYQRGNYAYLVHWNLMKNKPVVEKSAYRSSGFWRPTKRGIAFVRDRIRVPSHVYIFDNRPIGFTDRLISVRTALGKKFDYEEVMGRK